MSAAPLVALATLVGLACEMLGVTLMAHAYLAETRPRAVWRVLLSALVRGKRARGAALPPASADAPPMTSGDGGVSGRPSHSQADEAQRLQRSNLAALQGLALIGVGFIIQAALALLR